ncbi:MULTISPECIES: alpha-amylase family glycosyl hydrolase [unclassified Chelatococcus]|uniref:alpha-amylase family glycosyl hydrolase n=1 Tax=unclassified Chelatococcus TaxID=2638111 RepID=UPI0025BA96DE|nr:alpha-amylase family glycosyl hydrolase [Chelatococcus sp.]
MGRSASVGASKTEPQTDQPWWQRAVIYEIAAISFQDSNGDGIGDLPGLRRRLDYLRWLGVDAIWLTPIYRSPMLDLGYDISDFRNTDPRFGSMEDFDRLVDDIHSHGMRVILDFVPNHTSDQHPWFVESRSSKQNCKRNWYVWADPAPNGGPPNNWTSRFGGSAWQYEPNTNQYYYHAFLVQQPDLNWRNPEVREEMAGILRFWMARGVDGFRMDASAVLAEDELMRDDPPNPTADENTPPPEHLKRVFTDDRPESMTYIEELRSVIDTFEERVLAGEVQGKTDRIGHFYGGERPRLHLPLNFALLDSPWDALSLQASIDAYFNAIPAGAWPTWVIGGHDKRRIASKIGQAQARNLAVLLLTLRGTPFLFAGDELGAEQVNIPSDRIRDPFEKLVPGHGLNRDPQRAPMRWDCSETGGFTSGEPWLPMSDADRAPNVQDAQADPLSLLALYRALIKLRKEHSTLIAGDFRPRRSRNDIITYERVDADASIMVALNLIDEPRLLEWNGSGVLLLSTGLDRDLDTVIGPLLLRPNEGVIIALK